MTGDEIVAILKERFADRVQVAEGTIDRTIQVAGGDLVEVARFLRDDERLAFDVYHCNSGIDYPEAGHIDVTMHFTSLRHRHDLVVKCLVDRTTSRLPSLVELWPAADWLERETFDLVGVVFEGHPNLVRVLCAEDWVGHPLRRDYEIPAEYHGIPNDFKKESRERLEKVK